jgi:molybdopterin-binding protein
MNVVPGLVKSIIEDDLFVKIDVIHNIDRFSSCILYSDHRSAIYNEGAHVEMIFKEADTIIALGRNEIVSCRNRFVSKVTSTTFGTIMTRIVALYDTIPIVSLVTTVSARGMDIGPGSDIICMVKSTSMMIALGGEHPL